MTLSILPILIIAVLSDVRSRRIPNWLTCSAAAAGIIYHTATNGWIGWSSSMGGLLLGLALLIPFYVKGGMGAGDVKLMAALGALLGPAGIFKAWLFSAVVGGVYGLALLLWYHPGRSIFKRMKSVYFTRFVVVEVGSIDGYVAEKNEGSPRLCYGLAIAVGTLLSLLI